MVINMRAKIYFSAYFAVILILLCAVRAFAEMPRVYPGATSDNEANEAWNEVFGDKSTQSKASSQGWFSDRNESNKVYPRTVKQDVRFYLTGDSFDQVVEFYRDIATEDSSFVPKRIESDKERAPSEKRETYFLFDGAKKVEDSQSFVRVQYPAKEESDSVGNQNPRRAALSAFEKKVNKKTRIVVTTALGK